MMLDTEDGGGVVLGQKYGEGGKGGRGNELDAIGITTPVGWNPLGLF